MSVKCKHHGFQTACRSPSHSRHLCLTATASAHLCKFAVGVGLERHVALLEVRICRSYAAQLVQLGRHIHEPRRVLRLPEPPPSTVSALCLQSNEHMKTQMSMPPAAALKCWP